LSAISFSNSLARVAKRTPKRASFSRYSDANLLTIRDLRPVFSGLFFRGITYQQFRLFSKLRVKSVDYCTVENAKAVLQISEATWDAEIAECIASASALVDATLKVEGLAVPSKVPQLIEDASKFLAAWDFRRRREPAGAIAFLAEANRFLDAYIEGEKETYVGSV
jgi:hypothetical protein